MSAADVEFRLWSDDPSSTDLLSFDAVAATVADALLDEHLDPVALGLSGTWGSGKTTVLGLVRAELESRTDDAAKVLIVATDPWRYDPAVGAKESLIGEVLEALAVEVAKNTTAGGKATKLLGRLVKRVDWAKAIRLAARTSVTLQIPDFDALVGLVKPGEDEDDVRTLDAFRSEFASLMDSDELKSVRRLVVLVDDLDRCLPPTVVESLEAIRLFLAVPKMSFVIAADEERVADAIRSHFRSGVPTAEVPAGAHGEEPAKLYLHKIVQTTIPVPALSRFDTAAFLLLLQLQFRLDAEHLTPLVEQCDELRKTTGALEEITTADGEVISDELEFATRLTPILYEKLRGNPRRVKRFLNDLRVRQSVASRRGIVLDPAVVAKLMVLEVLLPDDFGKVLDWLARGVMREQIQALEVSAGRGDTEVEESDDDDSEAGPEGAAPDFSEGLLRWSKLLPSLSGVDLAPYLHLAATFGGTALLDSGLPEQLRDLAANLLSDVRAEQKSVKDSDLLALTGDEPLELVRHLGRASRDRPTEQVAGVRGVLRIARLHPSTVDEASRLLSAIPASEVEPAVPLNFEQGDLETFLSVLLAWHAAALEGPTKAALDTVLPKGGT